MAHTYVITSQVFLPPGTIGPTATNPDPQVQIQGTVDGVAVTVTTWFKVVNQPSAIAYQNAVTPLMLAAYNALQAPTATTAPPILTWTQ